MKIGFVLDDSLDRTDGVQQYVLALGAWLSKQGHEVHYLMGETRRKDISNIHSLSKNLNVKFNRNQLSMPIISKRSDIKDLLEREKYDVLHVQMPYSPFMGGRVIKLASRPTVLVGTFHIYPYSKLQASASKSLAFVQRRSLNKFDHIFSVSEPAQKFSAKTFNINSEVLPNVVDIVKYKNKGNNKSDIKNIMFLGRLVERKGCLQLLLAFHELLKTKNDINVRLIVCGKGPQLSKLTKYVKKHRLHEKVVFTGYVTEEQKIKYLNNADIAVFPSLGGESFGIVLLEAMAAGAKVVIGGDNTGYRSVLNKHPITLFDPRDTSNLANLLYRFINEPKLIKTTHEEQQKLVQQYDVGVVGKQLLEQYAKIIENMNDSVDNNNQ